MDEDQLFFSEGEVRRAPPRHELLKTIQDWLVLRFGLNDPGDKEVWLFCIGAAMELERLAAGVLWIDDGRPNGFSGYREKMSLGQAHWEIDRRGLLDPATRGVLKDVAELRNSVAHRHAVFVTAPSPVEGKTVGEYKGYHVFIVREALDELIRDCDAAAQTMYEWMAAKAPDLAEQSKTTTPPPP